MILKAETELFPFPKENITKIDEETFEVSFDIGAVPEIKLTSFTANQNVCVFAVVYNNHGREHVHIETQEFEVGNESYLFYIPNVIVRDNLDYTVLVGFSNGILGGKTKPVYVRRDQKSIFFYEYAYTTPAKYDYVFESRGKVYNSRLVIKYVIPEEDIARHGDSISYSLNL